MKEEKFEQQFKQWKGRAGTNLSLNSFFFRVFSLFLPFSPLSHLHFFERKIRARLLDSRSTLNGMKEKEEEWEREEKVRKNSKENDRTVQERNCMPQVFPGDTTWTRFRSHSLLSSSLSALRSLPLYFSLSFSFSFSQFFLPFSFSLSFFSWSREFLHQSQFYYQLITFALKHSFIHFTSFSFFFLSLSLKFTFSVNSCSLSYIRWKGNLY